MSMMFTDSKPISILPFTFTSILIDTFLYAPYLTLLMLKVNSQSYESFCQYSVRIIQLNLDLSPTLYHIAYNHFLSPINDGW